jgi:hypothetical protein
MLTNLLGVKHLEKGSPKPVMGALALTIQAREELRLQIRTAQVIATYTTQMSRTMT